MPTYPHLSLNIHTFFKNQRCLFAAVAAGGREELCMKTPGFGAGTGATIAWFRTYERVLMHVLMVSWMRLVFVFATVPLA